MRKRKTGKWYGCALALAALVFLSGPSAAQAGKEAPVWKEMEKTGSLPLRYAEQFSVDYYEEDYVLVTVADSDRFLAVPEDREIPSGLDEDIVVLQKPLESIYLVATSAMDLFCAIDGLDSISLSGTDADGWYIPEAKKAMEDGDIAYAGKYNAPDYERILSDGCDLAVESTMIYHNPEVKEKLEQFGIPVLVERSSYESHPLGRTEWMKLYGALLGKEEAAEAVFQEAAERLASVESEKNTGKTVAFFHISTNGYATVRKSGDYVSRMIELAGGKYIFDDLGGEENALSTMNMQMEEFYAKAKEADFLIYNSAIDGELETIEQLLDKSPLLADFRAVEEGNVWCTGKNLFQETTGLAMMIEDMHTIFTTDDPSLTEVTYMHRLK